MGEEKQEEVLNLDDENLSQYVASDFTKLMEEKEQSKGILYNTVFYLIDGQINNKFVIHQLCTV